ncbi:MAG TPA: hypothetical protein ENN22_06325 [bacterium]|nr:hypothetical protein [bacterium]
MMQNFLLIGAFIILGIVVLSLNNTIFSTNKTILENEVHITGIGLAQALMEEITAKAFDEKTTGNQVVRFPDQLTASANFGMDSGEPPRDDVDDYHNYSNTIDTPRIENYQLNVKIRYANPSNPIEDVWSQTFLKRIQITIINSKYMHNPDSLTISQIVAYYK